MDRERRDYIAAHRAWSGAAQQWHEAVLQAWVGKTVDARDFRDRAEALAMLHRDWIEKSMAFARARDQML